MLRILKDNKKQVIGVHTGNHGQKGKVGTLITPAIHAWIVKTVKELKGQWNWQAWAAQLLQRV